MERSDLSYERLPILIQCDVDSELVNKEPEEEVETDSGFDRRRPRLSLNLPARASWRLIVPRVILSRQHEDSLRSRTPNYFYTVFVLIVLILISSGIGAITALTYTGTKYVLKTTPSRQISIDHIFNGTFSTTQKKIKWIPQAGDGYFATVEGGNINLINLSNNATTTFVNFTDVTIETGTLYWQDWEISPSMNFVLFKSDAIKRYHRSRMGNYYIHDVKNRITYPLVPPTQPPLTTYAAWSPTYDAIAFVYKNDLYCVTSPSSPARTIRFTADGSKDIFNAVPDWVYEEEVLFADKAFWWSPDSSRIAFLRFNDSEVPDVRIPLYNPTGAYEDFVAYPQGLHIKYPKPGFSNPIVSLMVANTGDYLRLQSKEESRAITNSSSTELNWDDHLLTNDSIIFDIAWLNDSSLMLKEVNRNADDGNVVLFDLSDGSESKKGYVVRTLGKDGPEGGEGWVDCTQTIYPLNSIGVDLEAGAYLDIVPTPDGYNHIALFGSADNVDPKFLTSGEWEVSGPILAVYASELDGLVYVYFQAAYPTSTQRHIFSVSLSTSSFNTSTTPEENINALVPLTDINVPSFYRAQFSSSGRFYHLSYDGPGTPWQRIYNTRDQEYVHILEENKALQSTLEEYESATTIMSTVEVEGYELNVKEIRPPGLEDSGHIKYPLLFSVSNAPTSQIVNFHFTRDWHDYLACRLRCVVVVLDGRGTSFKGRKFRDVVKGRLGYWETMDQLEVAKLWASKPYIDTKKIGIWGWSYGGYVASKVAEANAGVHSLAMAVAPVTNWQFYDSLFTERYMNTPQLNPQGYFESSIHNMSGFHNIDYLLLHGTADINVLFENTAHILDMLTEAHVRRYWFRMFTDRNHVMQGVYEEVFKYMSSFLTETWGTGVHDKKYQTRV